jgi:hypothetical protein
MEIQPTFYSPEKQKERISLTPQQKDAVRQITMGIDVVDESVRTMAVEDVIDTLENGHPLNRIITGQEGRTIGYVACEDFVPREAYIKYFGTTGIEQTGRNPRQEISAFLDYAKQQGYTKLNFHGWNDRLNHLLGHYGFKRLRTDSMADFFVDFYEKSLVEEKSEVEVGEERARAFEQKYINELNRQYQEILAGFSQKQKKEGEPTDRQKKEKTIGQTFETLSARLNHTADFKFGDRQKAVLRLKLARYLQQNETCDTNVLYDAVVESPKFINTDKGSIHRLFEVHEQKTLQKIAEIRKRRAEITGQEGFNPYENLFATKSGNYYMARLLNMPHLEEESQYMSHCVGTSDSYINQIRRGDIEILSFRRVPKINIRTQKLEGDEPVMTIEYNLKTKTIGQMKKRDDGYLQPGDPFFNDVIDALKRLRVTHTDTGQPRDFKNIAASELENFQVKDYHILTENGEVSFRDFNPDAGIFIFKMGNMEITPDTFKPDAVKIIKLVEGVDCRAENIARTPEEVTKVTTVYIGQLTPDILKSDIEHIYASFPESKVRRANVEIGGKAGRELEEALDKNNFKISDISRQRLQSPDFVAQKELEKINLVRLTVSALGFPSGATTAEIIGTKDDMDEKGNPAPFTSGAMTKFGLELCPEEVGPHYRLQYKDQPMNEWLSIAMKQFSGRDVYPYVFGLGCRDGGLWLNAPWADPDYKWRPDREFVFRLRKSKT